MPNTRRRRPPKQIPLRLVKGLYYRPYVRGVAKCPVKLQFIGDRKIGEFPLKYIRCKRAVTIPHKTQPEYQGCEIVWHDEPSREIPMSQFTLDEHDPAVVTDDPMKWVNGVPPNFPWLCKDRFHVDERLGHVARLYNHKVRVRLGYEG